MNISQENNVVVPPSTLKRIYRDLEEIKKNPLFGASLCMPNQSDPLTLRANILILDGPYSDLLIHMVIHLPSDYPITGPAANIAPGLKFGHKFHEHLYDDLDNGNQICSDLLTNMRSMYDSSRLQKSGWTPSYTLSAVLLQLQVFFADPDLPKHILPTSNEIEELRKHVRGFKSTIALSDNQTVTHSFEKPYPPLSSMVINQKTTTMQVSKSVLSEEKEALRNANEWLNCAISKCNFFDNSNPILGYPLDIRQDQFGRYWPTPVVEMISYDAFILKVISDPLKLDNYENIRFKSSFGELYNFWIPVYINEDHWKRSYQHIMNGLSVVRKGFRGLVQNDFKPEMVLEVLPVILNKMIVQILQGKLHESTAAIQAYCHFYRLLIRLLVEFPELQQKIDQSVETMLKSEANRNKQNLGDMGEFLIKLALSKYGIQNTSINEVLIEECLARQVLWVLKEEPTLLREQMSSEMFLKTFIGHVKVSFQVHVVAVETVMLLVNDTSISQSDNNFGLLSKKTMDAYLNRLSWIKQNVGVKGNWKAFVTSFKLENIINSDEDMARMLRDAIETSARQGYTYQNSSVGGSNNSYSNPAPTKGNNRKHTHKSYASKLPSFSVAPTAPAEIKKSTTSTIKNNGSGKMSTATWDDLKVDLTGFDTNPVVIYSVPIKKASNIASESTEKKTATAAVVREPKTQKFAEEHKERNNTKAFYQKRGENKLIVESKQSDASYSTAENSMINENSDSKQGTKSYKTKHRDQQRNVKEYINEKPKYFNKTAEKDSSKISESKKVQDEKPKTVVTRVEGNGNISSSTWSEMGGIIKKNYPNTISTTEY